MTIIVTLLILAPMAFFLLLPLGLVKEFNNIIPEAIHDRYNMALFLLCISAILSGIFNKALYPTILGFLFFFVYIINLRTIHYCTSNKKVENILFIAFGVTILSAVLGLIGYWGIYTKETSILKAILGIATFDNSPDCMDRLSATFYNPNVAATFLASMLFVGAYIIKHRTGNTRYYACAGFAIIAVALICTGSRGAIIGGFLGLLFHFIAAQRKRYIIAFGVVFLMIIYSMFELPQLFERGELLFTSMDIRWGIWQSSWALFEWQPLWGWGFMGTFFAADGVYQYLRVIHPHNILLTILVFFGLVGMAIFIWLMVELIIAINKLYLKNNPLLPVLCGILGVVFGQGVFDSTIVAPQGGVLFFSVCAMIVALARNNVDYTDD